MGSPRKKVPSTKSSTSRLFSFPSSPSTTSPTEQELDEVKTSEHVLFVASQGGGGHISAILALIAEYEHRTGKEAHLPYLLSQGEVRTNLQLQLRELGSRLGYYLKKAAKEKGRIPEENKDIPENESLVAAAKKRVEEKIGEFLKWSNLLPEIPSLEELRKKANELLLNLDKAKYVDALLHPHGIVGAMDAVIWNSLQAAEKTEQLQDLLKRQADSDKKKHKAAAEFFYQELCAAKEIGKPYTKIVSTQAMTLGAICDAVIRYNKENKASVYVDQYLTDLATPGAVHFMGSLGRLTKKQRAVMSLHAVGPLNEMLKRPEIVIKGLENSGFKSVEEIKPEANPMVRKGFTEPLLDTSTPGLTRLIVKEKNKDLKISIEDHALVSTIMLGSQAGIATIDYAAQLIEYAKLLPNQPCYIFVLASNNQEKYFKEIREKYPELPPNVKLHVLGNQNDVQLGAIETRSNLLIQRAGGLSVMEAEAVSIISSEMKESPCRHKAIFVHHGNETPEGIPTSGISWEDANRDEMQAMLENKNIPVVSTTVARFGDQEGVTFGKDILPISMALNKLKGQLFLMNEDGGPEVSNKNQLYLYSNHDDENPELYYYYEVDDGKTEKLILPNVRHLKDLLNNEEKFDSTNKNLIRCKNELFNQAVLEFTAKNHHTRAAAIAPPPIVTLTSGASSSQTLSSLQTPKTPGWFFNAPTTPSITSITPIVEEKGELTIKLPSSPSPKSKG